MVDIFKVGDIVGIYKILDLNGVPSSDGHKRMHVKCTGCGVEKDIRPIHLNAKVCNHKQTIVPKYCKCCGKVIPFNAKTNPAKYKLRDFCSSSCAAKINNKRTHSEESKLKASKTALAKRYIEGVDVYKAKCSAKLAAGQQARSVKNASKYYVEGLVKDIDYVICPYCNLRFGQIQSRHLQLHDKSFEDLYVEFGTDYKVTSDKTFAKKVEGGKAVQQRLIDAGMHKGWQSRKISSYAEKFWQNVLDSNNITYEREFLVTCNKTHYFLDFKLVCGNKVIDLEIDGKQHTYSDRAESDVIRDTNLTDLGYHVYRIPWNEINSDDGKAKMKQKIEEFLAFYNACCQGG